MPIINEALQQPVKGAKSYASSRLYPSAIVPKTGLPADTLQFSGKAGKSAGSMLTRVWEWLKSLPDKLFNLINKLFDSNEPKGLASTTAKSELYSHIDPKLVNDPYERHRISVQLADHTFDAMARDFQNHTVARNENGVYRTWNGLASDRLTKIAQKLLNTNTKATVQFLDGQGMGLGEYGPPKRFVNGPNSSRIDMGMIDVRHPCALKYDLNQPGHRQLAYATYLHELQHMTRHYAHKTVYIGGPTLTEPLKNDPVKALYSKVIVGSSIGGCCDILPAILSKENPHLPNLNLLNKNAKLLTQHTSESIQCYWEPLKKMWERTDLPLLMSENGKLGKVELDELLEKGDPKIIKEWMEHYIVDELESYTTSFKRAPGLPKDKLQPADFEYFGAALYLRDMLRYYYQHPRHTVPLSEQHPMTQVKSWDEMWNYYNH